MAPEHTPDDPAHGSSGGQGAQDGLEQLRAARERHRREDEADKVWRPGWLHDTVEFDAITADLADIDHQVVGGTVVRSVTPVRQPRRGRWSLVAGIVVLAVVAISSAAARADVTQATGQNDGRGATSSITTPARPESDHGPDADQPPARAEAGRGQLPAGPRQAPGARPAPPGPAGGPLR